MNYNGSLEWALAKMLPKEAQNTVTNMQSIVKKQRKNIIICISPCKSLKIFTPYHIVKEKKKKKRKSKQNLSQGPPR